MFVRPLAFGAVFFGAALSAAASDLGPASQAAVDEINGLKVGMACDAARALVGNNYTQVVNGQVWQRVRSNNDAMQVENAKGKMEIPLVYLENYYFNEDIMKITCLDGDSSKAIVSISRRIDMRDKPSTLRDVERGLREKYGLFSHVIDKAKSDRLEPIVYGKFFKTDGSTSRNNDSCGSFTTKLARDAPLFRARNLDVGECAYALYAMVYRQGDGRVSGLHLVLWDFDRLDRAAAFFRSQQDAATKRGAPAPKP